MSASTPARPLPALLRTLLTLGAGVAFIGAVALIGSTQPRPDAPSQFGRGGQGANAGAVEDNPEAGEQAEVGAERAAAYNEAKEQGKAGQARPSANAGSAAATLGWA